uniref:Uncharacterized protein n=1 Tax=Physcomitrium patens TaxID=3218 RepID=A0A2K1IVY8_PHYPA|nr:hypothetical protein PHYPA_025387 [Physcomitrium patens]
MKQTNMCKNQLCMPANAVKEPLGTVNRYTYTLQTNVDASSMQERRIVKELIQFLICHYDSPYVHCMLRTMYLPSRIFTGNVRNKHTNYSRHMLYFYSGEQDILFNSHIRAK